MIKKHRSASRILAALVLSVSFAASSAAAQSGGNFAITESVIASGGVQNAAGGIFSLDGTSGQPGAGGARFGGRFAVTSGFWNFTPLAPSAANASISGRILTANGGGIRSVIVTLTGAAGGEIRAAHSSSFGYYRFEAVPVGATYVLTVHSKRFIFQPDTRVVSLVDELTGVDFTALPQ